MVSMLSGEQAPLPTAVGTKESTGRIVIERATNSQDLLAAFKGRHEVFVGEQIIGESKGGLVYDEFDALPGSQNFVAKRGGEVVGGCRATIGSSAGLPCDRYFDFSALLSTVPPWERSTGSYLWVKPEFRTTTIGIRLVGQCMEWVRKRGVRHVGAAIRPEAVPLFARLGWRAVAPQFHHPVECAPVVPMVAELLSHQR